jgi:rubredoxin
MRLRRTATVAAALVLVALPISAQRQVGVTHSATGHGSVADISGEPYHDQWSFSAVRGADGRVSGQVQYSDREAGYSFHARVIGLKVEGNRAKVSATLPEGWVCPFCGPDFHATHLFVVVVDNGEDQAVLDQISWGWIADSSLDDIEELTDMSPQEFLDFLIGVGIEPPVLDYFHGNIQVR